jgi:superfamily II RNA helicase
VTELTLELAELEIQMDEMKVEQESSIAEYHDLKEKIAVYEQDMKDVMNHPNYCLPFIQPGRLVKIRNEKTLFDWGVIVNHNKRLKPFVLPANNLYLTHIEPRSRVHAAGELHRRCGNVVRRQCPGI